MSEDFLKDIIDPQSVSIDEMNAWLEERLVLLRETNFDTEIQNSFTCVTLPFLPTHPCGAEGSALWRRFFLATLLADWACYERAVDRADFARLKYIMTSAYKYTRLWTCRLPGGQVMPVGYTLCYPIAKFVYEGLTSGNHPDLDDRGIFLPLRFIKDEDIRYGYAFNISIVKQLRDSACSRQMVRAYWQEAKKYPKVGVMAVTVDVAGQKFSKLLGMKRVGDLVVGGEKEAIFVRPPMV